VRKPIAHIPHTYDSRAQVWERQALTVTLSAMTNKARLSYVVKPNAALGHRGGVLDFGLTEEGAALAATTIVDWLSDPYLYR